MFTVAITGLYPFDESGPALALYAILKGLVESDQTGSEEISAELLVATRDPKYLALEKLPLLNIPMIPVLRNLKSVKGFETTVKAGLKFLNRIKKADIVFYNSPPTDFIASSYPYITRLARKKQIYYVHGSLLNEKVNSVSRKYFHLIARLGYFDRVVIPLESYKNLVSQLVCPRQIIATTPTCVITPWYEGSSRFEYEGDPVLLFAGRLAEVKRVDVLLRAFSEITLLYPSARLYIAGSGPVASFLEKLSLRLGISEKVTFLGHLRHNTLRLAYRSSDIFVLPSDAEFMSISLLEAMASKCAVVSSDAAATEVIKNGHNGLVFPHGDFKTLASNLSTLSNDETLRKKLANSAYSTVKENFDYRVVTPKLIKEMRTILQE